MGRLSNLAAALTDPAEGWDPRLWRLWALYSALAYLVILAVVVAITSLGLDATRVAVEHELVGALLIASGGALLYGGVLGRLQWRVLRERIPMPRRRWVSAAMIPALIIWVAVVVPAAVDAERAGEDLRVAYFLALSQGLALGPLVGFAQAKALQPYTRRWRSWVVANLVSWLLVYAGFFLVSLVTDMFGFVDGEGSPLETFVVLVVATPLSGRWMLWITARRATA